MSEASVFCIRHILTAAHCVLQGEQVSVRIGEMDRWKKEKREKLIKGKAIRPKTYSKVSKGWDVAVIILKQEIVFKNYEGKVRPICLVTKGLYNNNKVITTGWGDTKEGGEKVIITKAHQCMPLSIII